MIPMTDEDICVVKSVLQDVFTDCKVERNDENSVTIDHFLHLETKTLNKEIRTLKGKRILSVTGYSLSLCDGESEVDLGDFYCITTAVHAIASNLTKFKVDCVFDAISTEAFARSCQ